MGLLAVAMGCAPRWTRPEFRGEVIARAIATAEREFACPRERIAMRCDASSTSPAVRDGGDQLVYDEDGVIGTFMSGGTPTWEVELEVCGHVRRYRYDPPWPAPVQSNWGHPHDKQAGMVEVARRCDGDVCVGAEPACKNCGLDQWWPVTTTIGAGPCDAPVDDDLVMIDLNEASVELAMVMDTDHFVTRRCGESPLFVAVDGAWFSLCGSGIERWERGVNWIPTGLVIGSGERTIEAFAVIDGVCHRAKPLRAMTAPPRALSWIDL